MRAAFDNGAVVEYQDLVRIHDSADAMADNDGGPAAELGLEALEYFLLRMCVDGGEGVVEDEDAGIAGEGPGECGALALSSREVDAAFAEHGIETVRERCNGASEL